MKRIGPGAHDATTQVLEFARSGRLFGADSPTGGSSYKNITSVLPVLTGVAIGFGASILIVAIRRGSLGDAITGITLIAVGVLLLRPTLRVARLRHTTLAVIIHPGPVLPPELLRPGHWIRDDEAWVRVEEIGRDGVQLTALLSTGDVINLPRPLMIAGGAFSLASDPVASLRR